ncbi:hypothetical protein MHBO_004097 [Bonamia ostreae]|uniref:Uncharacterized protein n=1 Tax=Bonamia ostreae TaxID=126728 RepID=A0ABV2AT60_9EUKA
MASIDFDIRIDVSPVDPYSKVSQEISLDRLLERQLITFEEYVDALDDTSSVPKAKLEEILARRELQMQEQQAMEQEAMMQEQATMEQDESMAAQQRIDEAMGQGGTQNAMQ